MAAVTLQPHFSLQSRSSAETDRRHLLAESIAPSDSASFIDRNRTPRAHSPAPSSVIRYDDDQHQHDDPRSKTPTGLPRRDTIANPSTQPRPYRGFPSEAHYLAALHDWAESKKYLEPGEFGTGLSGFYGATTMGEYAAREKIKGLGLRKKWKARKARKEGEQREARSRNNTMT